MQDYFCENKNNMRALKVTRACLWAWKFLRLTALGNISRERVITADYSGAKMHQRGLFDSALMCLHAQFTYTAFECPSRERARVYLCASNLARNYPALAEANVVFSETSGARSH